ncbi:MULTISPECIES: murein biosynthesis integral membrane protein MurJ [unclassified Brevibacillus]|uniref:murein biosynthesis integral membrane protein MurJ n=1 Tax=unclassified Brevibacillus TaxID=2684853 RepID=UPI0035623177
MLRKLFKAGSLVFLGILLGRLSGFFRESVLATNLGITNQADIAVLILTLPDLLINILIGGAMGAALIPEMKQLGQKEAWRLFLQSSVLICAFFSLLSIVLIMSASYIVTIFAPGFSIEDIQVTSHLLVIVSWSIPITAMTAVATSFLQANNKFFTAALGTLIFNLTIITALLFPSENKLSILSYSILLGAVIRYVSQVINSVSMYERTNVWNGMLVHKQLILKYFQALATGGLIFLLPVIARIIGSYEGTGSQAMINYSNKFIELPLGAILTVFPVVLFPKLSQLFSNQETEKQGISIARESLRLVFILSVVMAISLSWFSLDFIKALFGQGSIPGESIKKIAYLTSLGLLALPAQGMSAMTQVIFNSKSDMKSPFYISLWAVIVYLLLASVLQPRFSIEGVIVALVIVNWAVLISHLIVLRIKHSLDLYSIFLGMASLKVLCASAAAFVPIAYLSVKISHNWFVGVIFALVGGTISLLASLIILKEYREYLFQLLRRRKLHD